MRGRRSALAKHWDHQHASERGGARKIFPKAAKNLSEVAWKIQPARTETLVAPAGWDRYHFACTDVLL